MARSSATTAIARVMFISVSWRRRAGSSVRIPWGERPTEFPYLPYQPAHRLGLLRVATMSVVSIALHPDQLARMGLAPGPMKTPAAQISPTDLVASIQLAQAACRHR
jgi:hypothetical protein